MAGGGGLTCGAGVTAERFSTVYSRGEDEKDVCVFLASGYKWGAVIHEIPISSPPS